MELGTGGDVWIERVYGVAFQCKAGRGSGVLDADVIFKPVPEDADGRGSVELILKGFL